MRLFAQLGSIEETGGRHWSAQTLEAETGRRAAALAGAGIDQGCTVAITHGGSADFLADLLAAWSRGATAACLDPALTAPEFVTLLSFIKPEAVLAAAKPLPWAPACRVLNLADAGDPAPLPLFVDIDPAAPALILFTSGTTGDPKGVVLSFGALAARIAANISAIGGEALARALVTLPTSFGHGLIGNALTPLFAGGTIVLGPTGLPLARDLARIVDEHRITFLSSVPALWRGALKLSRPPTGHTLLRVHVGSAPLSGPLWSEIAAWTRCEVVNCYGITETANWIGGASSGEDIADGLVGRPWLGEAAVLDDTGMLRAEGEGEIVLRSAAVMSGYLHRPDLTASVMQDGWYRSGDRGCIDAMGRIWITGRIKEEINRAGFKVQPAELDRLLEQHPAVAEACAFAQLDPVGGESVAVAIRLRPGASATSESLRAWCRERLRREAVPEHWHMVDEIPRNARGKVSRDLVRHKARESGR
jgi:oxalate---CoA ligase